VYIRLSHKLRTLLDPLVKGPLQEGAVLRKRVEAHVLAARAAAASGGPVDLPRAEQLGKTCLALLDDFPNLAEDNRRLVQGACLYFADEGDDEDDFQSVMGLEDDVIIANYVLAQLGRVDLRID
jgi:hypothetical protein